MELFVQDHLWQFPLNIILFKTKQKNMYILVIMHTW